MIIKFFYLKKIIKNNLTHFQIYLIHGNFSTLQTTPFIIDMFNNIQKQQLSSLCPTHSKKDNLQSKGSLPSTVTLADLNPSEKLKIGQLITTNQTYKTQIRQLTAQLSLCQSALEKTNSHLFELRVSEQKLSQQLVQAITSLDYAKQQSASQIQLIQQLREELQVQKDSKVVPPVTSNRECQTQSPCVSVGVQTKVKKTINCSLQTQVECLQVIPKDSQSIYQERERIQHQMLEELELQSLVHSQNREEDDVEECFEDLAKKWLQLKENNMKQLKKSYKSSKEKIKLPSGLQKTPKQPTLLTQTEEPEQIDQIQLNKLLKSREFSASRLLNSKSIYQHPTNMEIKKEEIPFNSDKNKKESLSKEKASHKNHHLSIVGSTTSRRETVRLSSASNENDLMDLVDSLT